MLRQPRPLTLAWASIRPAHGQVEENVAVTTFLDALRLRDLPATHGACYDTDPEMFFRDGRDPEVIAAAKEMCRGCYIRPECLLRGDGEHGIWGGLTAAERKAA